jgi:hypothetical protein
VARRAAAGRSLREKRDHPAADRGVIGFDGIRASRDRRCQGGDRGEAIILPVLRCEDDAPARREVCHPRPGMSPTVFRDGPFRFFFFSREEERLHIHVQSADGEAKFWIEPEIELARNYQLNDQDLSRVLQLVVDHEQEIRDAWRRHFGR